LVANFGCKSDATFAYGAFKEKWLIRRGFNAKLWRGDHVCEGTIMQTIHSSCHILLRLTLSFLLFATIMMATGFARPQIGEIDLENQRDVGEYRDDLKTFMKLSKSDTPETQRSAIFNLCTLHDELVRDSRYSENPTLQGFRATTARRLEYFADDFVKAQKRLARETKRKSSKSSQGLANQSGDSQSKLSDVDFGAGDQVNENKLEGVGLTSASDQAYLHASDSYHSTGQLTGGPSQLFNYAGGRFAPPWDHGPELVALIENTISPANWRSNGGPNSIHYFQPLRVLVISASQRTHDDTLHLLEQLRRSNGMQSIGSRY
jgi:hypothetical protein